MNMRFFHILLITAFFVGTVSWAGSAKVQSQQSNWTKIKEIFK